MSSRRMKEQRIDRLLGEVAAVVGEFLDQVFVGVAEFVLGHVGD